MCNIRHDNEAYKLLGDPAYETRVIMDALRNVTGGRYLDGEDSGNRNWVDDKSSLIGTESVDINVEGTLHLAGSQIANVKDGIDQGNLNISAGDLTWQDLQNSQESKSSGFGLSTNISTSKIANNQNDSSGKFAAGSTTVSAKSTGQETEGVTLATIGQGNITLGSESDLSGLNRDINNMDIITKDMITGALEVDVTVDHRLLSQAGRDEIKDQVSNLPKNLIVASEGAVLGAANLGKATKDTVYTLGEGIFGDKGMGEALGEANRQISQMQADHEFRRQHADKQKILDDPNASFDDKLKALEEKHKIDQKYGFGAATPVMATAWITPVLSPYSLISRRKHLLDSLWRTKTKPLR